MKTFPRNYRVSFLSVFFSLFFFLRVAGFDAWKRSTRPRRTLSTGDVRTNNSHRAARDESRGTRNIVIVEINRSNRRSTRYETPGENCVDRAANNLIEPADGNRYECLFARSLERPTIANYYPYLFVYFESNRDHDDVSIKIAINTD